METEYIQPNENEKILFVNIKKTYACKDKSSKDYRPSLYEAARKYWKLSPDKIKNINLLVAHVNGIVKDVFIPTSWCRTDNAEYKGRFEFEGIEILNSEYIGESILNLVKLGQNPVNYYNI